MLNDPISCPLMNSKPITLITPEKTNTNKQLNNYTNYTDMITVITNQLTVIRDIMM